MRCSAETPLVTAAGLASAEKPPPSRGSIDGVSAGSSATGIPVSRSGGVGLCTSLRELDDELDRWDVK